MAGHSKWKNIMHRKGAQDARRAKMFTKIIKEIMVAVRAGDSNPQFNPRLRVAIESGKEYNLPKDKIDAAIKKAISAGEGENYQEIRYEGYAHSGVAIIVDALTDNKNRTGGDIRSAFTKHGGTLGEPGSVSYMFNRVGLFVYPIKIATAEDLIETVVDIGADDYQIVDDTYEITCDSSIFHIVHDSLQQKYGSALSAQLIWEPSTKITLDLPQVEKVLKLIQVLEDNDDVQHVTYNMAIDDDVLEKISKQ